MLEEVLKSGMKSEEMLEGRLWNVQGESSVYESNWERIQLEKGLHSASGRFVCDCEARDGISELNSAVLQSFQTEQL